MKFPYAAFMCIIVSGLCFTMFIVFNYAYQNPDSGLFTKLDESAQKTMNDKWYDWFVDRKNNITAGFGMVGVVLLLSAILITVAAGFEHRRGDA